MKKIIEVKNLTKEFKIFKKKPGLLGSFKSMFNREFETVKAVNNISFTINEGELVGFIGSNGAGKTTTLKILSGLIYPDKGMVVVNQYVPWVRDRRFLRSISLVMGQKNQLWWDLPAYDSFLLNKEIYEVSDEQFEAISSELIDLLELRDVVNIPVRNLSLGQRMKCELVSSLLHNPKVLFLDEPTIGLDVVIQDRLRNFFKEYNKKFKTTILLTSHNMDDVMSLCNRLIILDKGEILFDGNISDLLKKYAKYKDIRLTYSGKVDKTDFEDYGTILNYRSGIVQLQVLKKDVASVCSKLLSNFKVNDLQIDEMKLEGVIREIFAN